jgi:hypothetical protein
VLEVDDAAMGLGLMMAWSRAGVEDGGDMLAVDDCML